MKNELERQKRGAFHVRENSVNKAIDVWKQMCVKLSSRKSNLVKMRKPGKASKCQGVKLGSRLKLD